LRVAAALIGELGADLGAAKSAILFLFWLALGPLRRTGLASVDSLVIGTEGLAIASCIPGVVGSGFVLAGRLRLAVRLLLAGAVGVAVAAVVFGLLRSSTQPPDVRSAAPSPFAGFDFYLRWLFPVPLLLVGAVLASLVRNR
jgi:hypothetical protein